MRDTELLERLVAAYSPSGRESKAVGIFVRAARELGYTARVDRAGNGVAKVGHGRPTIVFLGHIDTVDGRRPVRRRAGRIYGRGSVDAKGALAAALLAGRRHPGPGTLSVIAAVGEETDGRGARHLLRGPAPDAVIAGEPSGWDGLTVGYKGELVLTAEFAGERSHYSSPRPTAGDRAVDWVTTVRQVAEGARGDSPFRSLTAKLVDLVTERRGGRETARVTVDLRLPPGLSTAAVLDRLSQIPDASPVAVGDRVEPLELDAKNPVARALVEGIRAAGGRPTVWRKGGTSDLNRVVPVWKVPAAAYGPGDARLDHTDRESISEVELARSVSVLEVAFARLVSAPGPTSRRSVDGA